VAGTVRFSHGPTSLVHTHHSYEGAKHIRSIFQGKITPYGKRR
jgi:hypothetical protein